MQPIEMCKETGIAVEEKAEAERRKNLKKAHTGDSRRVEKPALRPSSTPGAPRGWCSGSAVGYP